MSERTADWDYFPDLYRFAVILTSDSDRALGVVSEALDAALKRPRSHGDMDRLRVLLFKDVRSRILKDTPARTERKPSAGTLPEGAADVFAARDAEAVRTVLSWLAEPGRSALTLLLTDSMDADEIARTLGLTKGELAEWLRASRAELHAGMQREVVA
ncbi:MAG: hypothetical protein WA771_16600 [Chthoniobacterales bacterium]